MTETIILTAIISFFIGAKFGELQYKSILKYIIKLGTAEKIEDKFYYLVEEKEYNKLKWKAEWYDSE